MFLLMWAFIAVLIIAVIFLFWLNFRKERNMETDLDQQHHLEEKIVLLEGNLKRTLEIMQELVKSVHADREILSQTVTKLNTLEQQNAELVILLKKYQALLGKTELK